ncbi:hypothetical protein ACFLRF_00435 [Candidatus Altiarchaeota archaeon]
MAELKDIVDVEIGDELHVCPSCAYELGFHSSFERVVGSMHALILICPNCGA